MKILIVDDEFHIRKLLFTILSKWGYEILETDNATDAFKIIQENEVSFIITDWVMPKVSGLELCQQIRNASLNRYIYIILLTSKNDKQELIQGMEAGADDFIVKPFNTEELKVRIRAGERIFNLESELKKRNKNLELAYETINNDLKYASRIQKILLPQKFNVISKNTFRSEDFAIKNIDFDWMYVPSSYLSGDIFNIFRLDEHHVGFYHLDVSGHGIPASMLSVTLSRMLIPFQSNFLKRSITEKPFYQIVSPQELLKRLNDHFCLENNNSFQYFTMVYMILDTRNGKVTYSGAGHTSPLLIKKNKTFQIIDATGFPIGLIENSEFGENEFYVESGDRIITYSDGITECFDKNGNFFTEEKFFDIACNTKDMCQKELISEFTNILENWHGSNIFEDDLSLMVIDIY